MNTNFEKQLMNLLEQHKDEIIKIRRYLHEHPELSFHEKTHLNSLKIIIKI